MEPISIDMSFSQAAAVLGGGGDTTQPLMDAGSLNTPPSRGQVEGVIAPNAPKRPRMEGG